MGAMTPDEYWNRRLDLERRLHDGPALRIAALTLHLGLLADKAPDLRPDIEDLQSQLHLVQQELRAIADRIYPPLLREEGLGAALRELAAGAPIPVRVDATGDRFDPAVEGVVYYTVREVLEGDRDTTRTVDITVRRDDQGLVLDLANVDTGQVVAVRDRVQWLGGAVEIVGGAALPTIEVRVPCG
jgi:signal transduction histidine kinase